MPLRVVGIVTGRPALAVIALAAPGAVQHDFVWPRQPVFVNIKIGRLRRRGLGDYPASAAIFCSLDRVSRRIGNMGRR